MRQIDTMRGLLRSTLLGCLALLFLTTANAQDADSDADDSSYYQPFRADESWFFKGRIGFTNYGGDRDADPFNEFQNFVEDTGVGFGLEAGYSFTNRFGLSLMHFSGTYPRIDENLNDDDEPYEQPAYALIDKDASSQWVHHFSLIGTAQVLPDKRISPYGYMGLAVSLGKLNDDRNIGIGPITGIGLDAAVSDRIGLFIELNAVWAFDDEKLDLADTQSKNPPDSDRGIDASDFDAFRIFPLGFGLRVNTKTCRPITVTCDGPTTLIPGETGTFTAGINEEATRPFLTNWTFGDGQMVNAGDLVATHQFTTPGSYEVEVEVSNCGGKYSDTATCPVYVPAPPVCRSVTANPATVNSCEPVDVQFNASADGASPITYRWDFGDGSDPVVAENRPSVSHTFPAPDFESPTQTFTTRLTLSNIAGTDNRQECSANVTVTCLCADNFELPPVFFDRNSSVLENDFAVLEASRENNLQNLRDNQDVLQRYPVTRVLVVGFAWDYERGGADLAQDRVRAVQQFYADGGVDPELIETLAIRLESRPKPIPPRVYTVPYCDDEARDAGRISSLVTVLQELLSARAITTSDLDDILEEAQAQGMLRSEEDANRVRSQLQ